MGIAQGAARILLKESRRRPFGGRVLVLGKQDVHFDYETLEKTARQFSVELARPARLELSSKPSLAESRYISDETLFLALGFDEYSSLDYSAYESAQYVFDLNQPDPPSELIGAFDVIADSGTIEHVFHLPNAFRNIFKMLKPNGRVIHLAPSSNYIDHGFYMFSPTLFWDFYTTNKFEINTFQVIRHTINAFTDPWEASDYKPGCLDAVSFGGLDDGMYAILCVATRTTESTGDAIPQQRFFARSWNPEIAVEDAPGEDLPMLQQDRQDDVSSSSRLEEIKSAVRQVGFLYYILRIPFRIGRGLRFKLRKDDDTIAQVERGLRLKITDRY